MLAPLTNTQSHEDGRLSEEEKHWLTMRAKGGYGLVMTCASHIQAIGKGFPGQLGIFSDIHIPGHQQLASEIKAHGSLAVIQLHHAGMRSPQELIGEAPVCPSTHEKYGCRALSLEEVSKLKEDYIQAAVRAKKAGYDGVELHGAHGYILGQFLSSQYNLRTDEYGVSLANRSRLLFEIMNGVREQCGGNFLLGVRLSPERFGMDIQEIKEVSQQLIDSGKLDFLDLSLWDYKKVPEEDAYQHKNLLDHFLELDFKDVKLTIAGRIRNGAQVQEVLATKVDFVTTGQAGIVHHDFPKRVIDNPDFQAVDMPVTEEHLRQEGVSDAFITYLKRRPGFVKE